MARTKYGADYSRREDRVGQVAAHMMKRDSPLMAKARADGVAFANGRGLGNTSLAGASSQSAVLDQIVPMASQTASQEFQKNVDGANYTRGRGLAEQASGLRRAEMKDDYGYSRGLAGQGSELRRAEMKDDYGYSRDLAGQGSELRRSEMKDDYGYSRGLAGQGSELRRGEMKDAAGYDRRSTTQQANEARRTLNADYDRRGDMSSQEARQGRLQSRVDFRNQGRTLDKEYDRREDLLAQEAKNSRLATRQDQRFTADEAELERGLRDRIAGMEIDARDRAVAQGAVDNAFNDYQDTVRSIMGNPDLSAEERSKMASGAKTFLSKQTNYTATLHSTAMAWPTGGFAKA